MLSVKNLFFIIALAFFSPRSFANEHGEAPAAGEHGGAAAAEAAYSGKQSQEWSEIQTKLSALKGKVEAQENLVKSLMLEGGGHSASAPSGSGEGGGHGGGAAPAGHSGGMSERIEQLKKEHAKLQSLIADYNKMNADYETRFPEKGLKESRIYRRIDPQALRFDEAGSTYEERVQRLQNKILRQYPKTSKKLQSQKKAKPDRHDEHSPVETKKNIPQSGDVTEQIILKK